MKRNSDFSCKIKVIFSTISPVVKHTTCIAVITPKEASWHEAWRTWWWSASRIGRKWSKYDPSSLLWQTRLNSSSMSDSLHSLRQDVLAWSCLSILGCFRSNSYVAALTYERKRRWPPCLIVCIGYSAESHGQTYQILSLANGTEGFHGPTRLSTLHHTYSIVMCSNKRSKTASSWLSSKRLDSFLCIFATSVHASHQYSICGEHQIFE